MGLIKLIFRYPKIFKKFCSGPFLTFFQKWRIKKMPRAKKVINIKNQFLHARQPCEGIFDIFSHQRCIFTITCQSFKQLPVIQFWELMSKNEIWRTISCIYFMKICVRVCFVTSGSSLVSKYLRTFAFLMLSLYRHSKQLFLRLFLHVMTCHPCLYVSKHH